MRVLFIISFVSVSILHTGNVKCAIKIYDSQAQIKNIVHRNVNADKNGPARKSKRIKCMLTNILYTYELNKDSFSCGNECFQELWKSTSRSDLGFLNREDEDGDTITYNDIVSSQYRLLPYPPVPDNTLLKEYIFYKNHELKDPIEVFPTGTLETINHHFFQGNQNFRYNNYCYH